VLVLGRHGIGSGSVSLFAANLAAGLGASRVVYLDPDAERRAIAAGFAASRSMRGPPPGSGTLRCAL
jgi:hypothetical protein